MNTTAAEIINNVRYTNISQKSQKMSAALQREALGAAVFGRKDFYFNNTTKMFTVTIHICYGSDYIKLDVTPEMVAEAVNSGKKIEHYGGRAVLR